MSFGNPELAMTGVVCLARHTFDVALAARWYLQAQAMVGALDEVRSSCQSWRQTMLIQR